MKYLIVGLGNIGDEYQDTRHNIGFKVLDTLAKVSNTSFSTQRYGSVATMRVKNKSLVLLKPSTYMNLSGEAVRYWMTKENIPIEKVLIIVDDIALPLGSIRLKGKGSDAGHNGLKNITALLQSDAFPRLKFGIGNDYPRGCQVEYVLGRFLPDQEKIVVERIEIAIEAIKSFCLSGLSFTMTNYNNK